MKRDLRITLVVTVGDLPDDKRKECLDGMGGEAEYGGKLPDLRELTLPRANRQTDFFEDEHTLAGVLASWISAPALQEDMFAGSELYVAIEEASVSSVEWLDRREGERPADRSEG